MKKLSASSLVSIGFMLGAATTAIGASQRGSLIFPDVPAGSYYDEAVGDMYASGIITGYNDGRFGPDDFVTRGQVAVMLQRFRKEMLGTSGTSSSRSSSSRSSSSSSSSTSTTRNDNGVFRFTTSGFTVDEDNTDVTVTVIRSEGADGDVTVEYEATAGTATAGDDFDVTSGRLSFGEDETSKTFTVEINEDSNSEGNETITLTLKSPTGGAGLASPSTATITIKDDESPTSSSSSSSSTSSTSANGVFNFNALEFEILENAGQGTITVAREGGTTGEVAVNYATSNGTAGSSNFASKSGTLTFAAGETVKSFTIDVFDNTSKNGNKTGYLTLTSPTGGAILGTYNKANMIIVDDDVGTYGSGSLAFTKESYDVSEGAGTVTVIVNRLKGTKGTITVDYATVSSSAKAGTDFTHTAGKLTFLNGESQKPIYIPIKNGDDDSGEESFRVELTNPSSGIVIDQYSTTVNIQG